ncbi:hypothetical protein [Virgibacillus sp. JSM 102003]|uniref:hypothetical protein n=1 Tax=Virgibacillus sp. JSM 102003 TaxID=1562108 RepID=UPI0035BED09E
MLKNILFRIAIGVITILFSSYALITHNEYILLLPSVQLYLGLIAATMLVTGVSALHERRKRLGLFFTFVSLFIIVVILLNNSVTIEGIIPVIALFFFLGIPIGIIAMFTQRMHNKSGL